MPSLRERAGARLREARARRPLLDHLLRVQAHYGSVRGSQHAGAVTYFGFLSVFPILALAVFAVGWVSRVYPGANADLRAAIDSVLPGLLGGGEGKISLSDIRTFSGWAAVAGVAGVLYSGLGWVSALRDALVVVFELPAREQPGFVAGKLRDLLALVVLGLVLLVAVPVAGFARGFSGTVLDWVGLGDELGWLVGLVSVAVGLAANAVLFWAMFRILAEPHTPPRSLWSGAVLGAVLFELMKQASQLLLAGTRNQPAFQAFGIALILLVWISYFSRLVLYAAAWAHTGPAARAARQAEPAAPLQGPRTPALLVPAADAGAVGGPSPAGPARRWAPLATAGAAVLALTVVLTRRKDQA